MELTREELKKLLHSATGNIKDFVTNNDKFIDDWITENKVNDVVLDAVIKCQCNHKIEDRFPTELLMKECEDCNGVL